MSPMVLIAHRDRRMEHHRTPPQNFCVPCSKITREDRWRSGDLPLVLELKFQFFDELGQSLSRKRIGGLQGQPIGLLQLPFQFLMLRPGHFSAPANWTAGSLKCSRSSLRTVNSLLFA